ncbi:MAG: ricin-type beta-trefoil lectin domain protein [Parashewanella sp.]
MKDLIKYLCVTALITTAYSPKSTAASADDAVHQLAQGCYAIKSPERNRFLIRYHKGGPFDDGLSYKTEPQNIAQAERFYFKPTKFKHFLIYDRAGRYLAGHQPVQASSGRYAGPYAEFRTEAVSNGKGGYHFKFHSVGMNHTLRHDTGNGGIFYSTLVGGEQQWDLVPTTGCRTYPEAELNIARTNKADQHPRVGDQIKGFSDVHTHLNSNEFMGGRFLHGDPFHPYGVAHALDDGSGDHGPWGALDIIGNLMGEGNIGARHDTRGWPDFPSWPKRSTVSHQQAYYKWIERSHKAGLRVMVTHLVENEVLCNAQSTINPAGWIKKNSCNTMDSIRLQAKRLKEMQAYIDAQSGGPGKGFFRIVKSQYQARQVISQGKLAVIMGIEASELFNCGSKDAVCTRKQIDDQLTEVYNLGVRTFYPIHRFDNQFGGTRIEDGFINVGQKLSTGRFFETKACKAGIDGRKMTSGFPLLGTIPVLRNLLNAVGLQPQYDANTKHCNRHGLSELGVYLVNRMIDKKIMIELDHTSFDTSDAILKIAEARNYSGVISGHSHLQRAAQNQPSNLHERIAKLGGILASYNFDTRYLSSEINNMIDVTSRFPYLVGVGIGTDVNGLAQQAKARSDIKKSPVRYPFTSFDGRYTFQKQKTGNRTFDYNNEGIAHYGLLADHIEDLRANGSKRVYDSVFNSAEAYLQMWDRSEKNNDRQFINPLPSAPFALIDSQSGKCLDIAGNDNGVHRNANVQLWQCDTKAKDQKWIYEPKTGQLKNFANPNFCMDFEGQFHDGGKVKLYECVANGHPNQAIDFVGLSVRSRTNINFSLDANGQHNGANVSLWWHDSGKKNQRFIKSTDTFSLVDKRSGKCLDVPGDDNQLNDHVTMQIWDCQTHSRDQKWSFIGTTDRLMNMANPNMCLDFSGQLHNGGALILHHCNGGGNQAFDFSGDRITPKGHSGFSVDASSTHNGAKVTLWSSHGGNHQKWEKRSQ